MVKMLEALSAVVFITAVVVSGLCVAHQLYGVTDEQKETYFSILEKHRRSSLPNSGKVSDTVPPLVRQAKAFALYLNPPAPPEPEKTSVLNHEHTLQPSLAVKLTPKFILVATCCYRSNPEKSMALVSEPGAEDRWIKQGARLGHFTIEQISKGKIIYRNGSSSKEMAVTAKPTTGDIAYAIESRQPKVISSRQRNTSPPKPSNHPTPEEKPHKPLHKLGPRRPET